jgi:hypothetical protein
MKRNPHYIIHMLIQDLRYLFLICTIYKYTVRFFKLESITLSREKNSKISHNISISPAIVRSDTGKLFSLIESNLEKICTTDFKSLREIPIYTLLNIFAQYGFHCEL